MLLRDVEVGTRRVDVRLESGRIAAVGIGLSGHPRVDGGGGALLPGLHDHHLHLVAAAAARESVPAGPPQVRTADELRSALIAAQAVHGWLRAVGYDEAVAGALDRDRLDELCPDRPLRVQHRSGALWIVNSAGADALGLAGEDAAVIERDGAGRPTGRLWRADTWLAERLGRRKTPDLAPIGSALSAAGVTGCTDATPTLPGDTTALLASAHRDGTLPQRITVLAADIDRAPDGLSLGPAKLVVADHELPSTDELARQVTQARRHDRAVAVHCVTREALLLVLTVLAEVGPVPGDRIEHAAVAPTEAVRLAASLGVVVVTQPSLVALRGDDYLDRVEADDLAHLWPWASLRRAGVPVAGSSDAPYGDLDPWAGMRAAIARTTSSGRRIGTAERVNPRTALAGWLTAPAAPGGPIRRVRAGAPADLVLLDTPLADVLAEPDARHVALTIVDGELVYEQPMTGLGR